MDMSKIGQALLSFYSVLVAEMIVNELQLTIDFYYLLEYRYYYD